jgi:hypothetical protein
LKYLPKGAEEGEEILMFRKAWEKNTDGALDTLMKDMNTEDEPELETEIIDDIEILKDNQLHDIDEDL